MIVLVIESCNLIFLKADELIHVVGELVQRNTAQTPKGSALKNVGDLGGVFTFQKRR